MQIRASGTLNLEAVKALYYFHIFKKKSPQKEMRKNFILTGVAVVVAVFAFLLSDSMDLPSKFLLGLVVGLVACVVLLAVLLFAMPKYQYNALEKMKDAVNNFAFYDDSIHIVLSAQEYNGETDMQYSMIFKVGETKRYFFIYQNKTQVFVVDKSTFADNEHQQVAQRLQAVLGEKYVLCDY
ncbi:MAG: YcxB family protein [Clostridia bacterium]|nr:YcxB family protein [Clostridia bacterium]